MVTALIKFTQGVTVGNDGEALIGSAGTQVDVENSENTGVASWRLELVYAPPEGAVLPNAGNTTSVILDENPSDATPVGDFMPTSTPGCYRVKLTVWDQTGYSGNSDVDIRVFAVPEGNYGIIFPPYQQVPEKLPPVGSGISGAKPDEMNFGGQEYGWDGAGDEGLLLDFMQQVTDGTVGGTDPDAIHDNVAGEISAIAEKVVPSTADIVVIEDSEDANNKKKVELGNIGIAYKAVAKAATTFGLPPYSDSAGALTADQNGPFPFIDGVTISEEDTILLKNIAVVGWLDDYPTEYGFYELTDAGSASTPWVLTRAAPYSYGLTVNDSLNGTKIYVQQGNVNAGLAFEFWSNEGDVIGTNTIGIVPTRPLEVHVFDNSITGTHDGGNNESVLTDSGESWTVNEFIGYLIVNTTDGSFGVIVSNTSDTITATLAGGTDDDWDTGDVYYISETVGGAGFIVSPATPPDVYKSIYVYTEHGGTYEVMFSNDSDIFEAKIYLPEIFPWTQGMHVTVKFMWDDEFMPNRPPDTLLVIPIETAIKDGLDTVEYQGDLIVTAEHRIFVFESDGIGNWRLVG